MIGVRGEPNSKDAKLSVVVGGSPADKAGIKAGDVVLKFGGIEITDFPSLTAAVREKQPGERIKVLVRRGEEQIELAVIIGKKGG
jgi:S1-C subfamily serine protease